MGRTSKNPIPIEVIKAAIDGDSDALDMVCNHYQQYIRYLSIRPIEQSGGRKILCVDEDMCLRLKAKLLTSIVTSFSILPK